MNNKITTAISIVALVIAVIVGFIAVKGSGLGSGYGVKVGAVGTGMPIENYFPAVLYNGGLYTNLPMQVGASGNAESFRTHSLSGVILGANLAQPATTSQAYDIAVTGVLTGDTVFVTLATTTPSTNLGWKLLGANASSTSGFITLQLQNLTGATQSISAGGNAGANSWGSTTEYIVVR